MKAPNPYTDTAFDPLDDDWLASQPPPTWNTATAKPPPAPPKPRPANTPRPLRSAGVKLTQQTLQIGTDPKAVLPERADRQYLLIQNNAGAAINIGFSEVPAALRGIEILVGGAYELRDPAPTNQIYVVCPTGTATVSVLEG